MRSSIRKTAKGKRHQGEGVPPHRCRMGKSQGIYTKDKGERQWKIKAHFWNYANTLGSIRTTSQYS